MSHQEKFQVIRCWRVGEGDTRVCIIMQIKRVFEHHCLLCKPMRNGDYLILLHNTPWQIGLCLYLVIFECPTVFDKCKKQHPKSWFSFCCVFFFTPCKTNNQLVNTGSIYVSPYSLNPCDTLPSPPIETTYLHIPR